MAEKQDCTYRSWEYDKVGDYHRDLDPNWSYTPTYLCKMTFVQQKISKYEKSTRILDAGCGEGVLVEKYQKQGYQIEGLDLNYGSKFVRQGSVLEMPYQDESFDLVLLLDVFEHLAYADQPKALAEIRRVLSRRGCLIASIPNLAHWNSRFSLFFSGRLDRTDIETNHIGERPFKENWQILQQAGLKINQVKGVTLTVPYIYRKIICRRPARYRWLHDLMEPLALPSLAMINIFVCQKV